jgi:hypothetical protein
LFCCFLGCCGARFLSRWKQFHVEFVVQSPRPSVQFSSRNGISIE